MTMFSFRGSISLLVGFAGCYSPNDPIAGDGSDDASTGATVGAETSNTVGSATVATTASTNTTDTNTTNTTGTTETDATDATQGTDATDSLDTSAGSTDDGGPLCGNARMDDGEACDDGDEINGNGCNNDCVESGTVLWELELTALQGLEHAGLDIAVAPDGLVIATGENGWIGTFAADGVEAAPPVEVADIYMGTIAVFADGDLAVGDGESGDFGEIRVHRMTTEGAIFWSELATGAGSILGTQGLAVDEDENVLAVGTFPIQQNLWFGEFASDGSPGWNESYTPNAGSAGIVVLGDVACEPSGECTIVGAIDSNGALMQGGRSGWFQQISPNGVEIWTRTYDPPSDSFAANCVAMDQAGNAAVIGSDGADVWIRKYSPEGGVLWTVTYDDPNNGGDGGYGCAFDGEGNVVAVGAEARADLGEGNNAWIGKYDPDGGSLWTATYNSAADGNDQASQVAIDATGRIFVVGTADLNGDSRLWLRAHAP